MKRVAPEQAPKKRRRWLLVPLLLAFAAVVAVGGAYHRARAQLDEGLMDLGMRMMHYADATDQNAPRDLVVNGQVMHISTGTAAHGATRVLDHFEARCADADGELMEQLDQLQREHPGDHDVSALEAPIIREQRGRRGYVACLDLGPTSVTVTELGDRLARYGQSGDVSDIGDARYVFVEELRDGDELRTHFVALWTSGSFNLRRMFPQDGDVPGEDPDGLARPPESRRVLAGFERGQPHTLTVYETRRDEADLGRFFRRSLPGSGWSLLSDSGEHPELDAPRTLVAERDERMAIVVLQTSLETGRASAAIFETR